MEVQTKAGGVEVLRLTTSQGVFQLSMDYDSRNEQESMLKRLKQNLDLRLRHLAASQ